MLTKTIGQLTEATTLAAMDKIEIERAGVSYYGTLLNSDGAIPVNGVAFPAAQVASADPNTLDDYEEGTWEPTIIGSSTPGTQTYSEQSGLYTKIGNVCTVQGRVSITAKDAAMSGNTIIGGLPFAAKTGVSRHSASFAQYDGLTFGAGRTQLGGTVNSAATSILLFSSGSGVTAGPVSVANTSTATLINVAISYQV
jgi:hypothetical protein